jgi:hypothetical protein
LLFLAGSSPGGFEKMRGSFARVRVLARLAALAAFRRNHHHAAVAGPLPSGSHSDQITYAYGAHPVEPLAVRVTLAGRL